MKINKKYLITIILAALSLTVILLFPEIAKEEFSKGKQETTKSNVNEKAEIISEEVLSKETPKFKRNVIFDVPFVSQAPTGNWSDNDYQNGCEEASMIMVMSWVRGEKMPTKPEEEIKKITKFEHELFGKVIDTSAEDTAILMQKYYRYDAISVKEDISIEDIKTELDQGKIVIAPLHGRDLKNPNFTSPGPITHMAVIVGYDEDKNIFIVNDPGTRKGNKFQYSQKTFFDSLWNYSTGETHAEVPPMGSRKTAIIIVEK